LVNIYNCNQRYDIYVQPSKKSKDGCISSDKQANYYAELFDACGIRSSKLTHAPRAGGLNMAEMQEVKDMDLRRGKYVF
jgi:hypothetical protein